MKLNDNEQSQIENIRFFLLIFGIVLAGQLIYWLAYYPGGFNLDAYGQWMQIHGDLPFNNWHPIITTVLYWLLTRIIDSFAFCILFQILLFSFSLAWLLKEMKKEGIQVVYLVLMAIWIALNPAVSLNNICLIKDVPFTIAIIWVVFCSVKIYCSDGKWLDSITHKVLFSILTIIIMLIRYNGLFYIVPLYVVLTVVYRKRILQSVTMFFLAILCVVLINDPLLKALKVEEQSNVVGESVGVPMAIMANALLTDPENTPEEVKNFLLEIAPFDEWRNHYILGEWDSCKWEFGGTELFRNESLSKILKMTIDTVAACPEASWKSFAANTRVIWQIVGYQEWNTQVYIEPNEYGIVESHIGFFEAVVKTIEIISCSYLGSIITWNNGIKMLLLLASVIFIIARKEYDKLLFVLPSIIYTIFTMLLLCGPSERYFYYLGVIIIPVLFLILHKKHGISDFR